jgi:hypothetical protein
MAVQNGSVYGLRIAGAPRRGLTFQYRAADAFALGDNCWPDTGLQVC